MRIVWGLLLLLAGLVPAQARTWTVGPEGELSRPSQAAKLVRDGDTVLIDARGRYDGDVAVWRANRLTIRGVNGRPLLRAAGRHAQGKGIWVIRGEDVVVENIAFEGARVPHRNGAGIRFEAGSLTVRRCLFRDNENGILTPGGETMTLTIEDSEFIDNGAGDGYTHHVYAGAMARLVVQGSRFLRARKGHQIKSRARTTVIRYNRLEERRDTPTSYAIDIPNGGQAWIVGNLIHQAFWPENDTLVAYGLEGIQHEGTLYLVHNTLVNDYRRGVFLRLGKGAVAWVGNNVFAGPGRIVKGGRMLTTRNLLPPTEACFLDPGKGDYRPCPDSRAVDAAESWSLELPPQGILCCQPPPPGRVGLTPRRIQGRPDLGAFEAPPLPTPTAGLP